MSNLQKSAYPLVEDSSGPQRSQPTKQKLTLLLFFTFPCLQELPFFFSHCYKTPLQLPQLIANTAYHSSLITVGLTLSRSIPRLNRLSTESHGAGHAGFRQTRLWMTVLSLVGNDEHVRVILGSLHVLSGRTPSHATALVVPSAITKKNN